MRAAVIVATLSFFTILVNCGSGRDTPSDSTGESEQGLKVCPLLAIYCPPECHQTGGGCPTQCHCPNYVACGPTLHCRGGEVCCTGPGPVSIDPSLNTYTCNPTGSVCPL